MVQHIASCLWFQQGVMEYEQVFKFRIQDVYDTMNASKLKLKYCKNKGN